MTSVGPMSGTRAMTSRWFYVALLVVVVGIAIVWWRGSDAPEDRFASYCATVEEHRPLIGVALKAGPTTGLIRALPSFEALSKKAPDDIADDWAIVIDSITGLVDALDAASVDPASYDRSAPPAGLTREEKGRIDAAATALAAPATAAALAAVEQQARDVCGSPLSL